MKLFFGGIVVQRTSVKPANHPPWKGQVSKQVSKKFPGEVNKTVDQKLREEVQNFPTMGKHKCQQFLPWNNNNKLAMTKASCLHARKKSGMQSDSP